MAGNVRSCMGDIQICDAFKYFLRNCQCAIFGGIREYHDEFLAAIAADQVSRTMYGQLQRIGDLSEAIITRLVSIVIIVTLEKINICENKR